MNHTQRIAHVARQRRYLTKAVVKEAVESYLEVLADEIASGEWVDIKSVSDKVFCNKGSQGKLWW